MVSEVRIYVEGGGNSAATKGLFRTGIGEMLRDLRSLAHQCGIRWHIVACGGRQQTFDDFQTALRQHPNAFNVLLVDAEGPVSEPPWEHLRKRDGWQRPAGVSDEQCQLMVQTMEAWFIADPDMLRQYYGQGFRPNALPRNPQVEMVDRQNVARALSEATRHTSTKGEYHKIHHATDLLRRLDVARVRVAAPHCERLFSTLTAKIRGS